MQDAGPDPAPMALDFSRYDTRHYRTVAVRDGYAAWSRFYDSQMDGKLDLDILERVEGVDWAGIRSAVDLGCGSGRTGAWLAGRGARGLDGIDLTPEMLALARSLGVYRSLREEDMCATSLPAGRADAVVSCLAVGHVPDLEAAYAEADRLLRPGGLFVLVGYHPFFLLTGVPTHFHGDDDEPVAIQNHVHLISHHVSAGATRDWVLEEMHERVVDSDWVDANPNWTRHLHKPASFGIVWRRKDGAPSTTIP